MSERPRLKIACPTCRQKLDVSDMPAFLDIQCPVCEGGIIVPKSFGEILLEEVIGTGGMASVYRALDLTLDREVAVKILKDEIASADERSSLFLYEARAAAAVNHINVVPIYSCGQYDGQPYLVMQYMVGHSLDHRIREQKGSLRVDDCLRYAQEAANGLRAALHCGIVHHDVKPANILLDAEGSAKVGDFGLAQVTHDDGISGGGHQSGWVTPYYVSPEKASTGREDFRGDMFSLGATLYHLLTGEPPFTGPNPQAIIDARLERPPPGPRQVRNSVPEEVSTFVIQLMARHPEGRPGSYDEVIEKLSSLRSAPERAPLQVRRKPSAARPQQPVPMRVNVPPPTLAASAARSRRSQRRKGVLLNVAIGICLILLVVLLAISRSGGKEKIAEWLRAGGISPSRESTEQERAAVDESRAPPEGATAVDAAIAALRPRPPDLEFRLLSAELADYLANLSGAQKELEKRRLGYVMACRGRLMDLMTRLPYDDEEHGVVLRTGERLSASVPFCNERGFGLRLRGDDAGEARQVAWADVAFPQFVAFFEFYINRRLDSAGGASASRDAAAEYLQLALLCDWYGESERAKQFCGRAVSLDASLREEAGRLLP